jgi:hypothetical protein
MSSMPIHSSLPTALTVIIHISSAM